MQIFCIDFSRLPDCCDSYESYIARIRDGLKEDLRQAYPQYVLDLERPVWDLLSDVFSATGERFVFILDEWDAIFHMSFVIEKAKEEYTSHCQIFRWLRVKRVLGIPYGN